MPTLARGSKLSRRYAIIMLLAVALGASPAAAATRTVTSIADDGPGSFRQALAEAQPGDTIDFAVTGKIVFTGFTPRISTANLTIQGPGAKVLAISANNDRRVLDVDNKAVVTISGLTFTGGSEFTNTGGILNSGTLTLNDCAIVDNVGAGLGNSGTMVINRCTIANNLVANSFESGADGGGIANSGALTVSNSTIANNLVAINVTADPTQSNYGAGIYNSFDSRGPVVIRGCTIFGNRLSGGLGPMGGGGGIGNASATPVTIENSIVASNASRVGPDVRGPFASGGYNLIGDKTDSTGFVDRTMGDQVGGGGSPAIQPRLGALADNGGTTSTMALLAASPALDQGLTALATDQRGSARKLDLAGTPNAAGGDASDIGAFEFNGDADAARRPCTSTPILIDPSNDQIGTQPSQDIESVTISEPFTESGEDKIVFILKVADLSSTKLPNQRYRVTFRLPQDRQQFPSYIEYRGPLGFQYAIENEGGGKGSADPASNITPDGTITMVIAKSKLRNLATGQKLTNVSAAVLTDVDALIENDRAPQSQTGFEYQVTGNCAAPQAVPNASRLLNISTRARVQTGEKQVIAGFILGGGDRSRSIVVRGIGPSLASRGVSNVLADPRIQVLTETGFARTQNDNWRSEPVQSGELQALGLAPENDAEAALVDRTLPGVYTAVLSGVNDTTGLGLIEVYDINTDDTRTLLNISTRASVETGDNVMIAGFIVGGGEAAAGIVVRAIGPSLSQSGVSDSLQDPTLELRGANGDLIRDNDNWKDSQRAEIEAAGLPPGNDAESAIVASLPAGNYTSIVRGKGDTTGVALVEVYNVQ